MRVSLFLTVFLLCVLLCLPSPSLLRSQSTGFVELVSQVESKGKAENEILTLQTTMDDIEGRNTNLNLERIEGDLNQVKKENKILAAKIKAAAATK